MAKVSFWREILCILLIQVLFLQGSLQLDCNPSLSFDCGTGLCINKDWKCDGAADCPDKSDEQNCKDVELTKCNEGEFQCGPGAECIPNAWKCDGEVDCQNTNLDEANQTCPNHDKSLVCEESQFACLDQTRCIAADWVCDLMADCDDGSDETCPEKTCHGDELRCNSGECVSEDYVCDHQNDCEDGSDELNCTFSHVCPDTDMFKCASEDKCLSLTWKCDGAFDCDDHSDELNCGEIDVIKCHDAEFMCKSKDQCVHIDWRCDQEADCFDDSDEFNCTHTCGPDEFQCTNDFKCIAKPLQCDGDNDCNDGSDETNCTITCAPNQFSCKSAIGEALCLDPAHVCDGVNDCGNFEDESKDKCGNQTDPCADDNGGCLQLCIRTFGNGHRCACNEGYRLVADNTCEDIDECAYGKETRCSQKCTNLKGSFKCECMPGYTLDHVSNKDGVYGFCRVDGIMPLLLVATRHDIRSVQITDIKYEHPAVADIDQPISFDYDYSDGYLFWSDVRAKKIFRAKKESSDEYSVEMTPDAEPVISENIHTPDGVAVDWIYNHFYWTDAELKTINLADFDGNMRKTIIRNLDKPRAIVLDPMHGYMYFTDWGTTPKITKCGMNNDRYQTAIVTEGLEWPNGITIDSINQRLYWVDAKLNKIMTSLTDGSEVTTVLSDAMQIEHPFSITVFQDSLYWTDWKSTSIRTVNKFSGKDYKQVTVGLTNLMDIHVYHSHLQMNGTNHCIVNQGGCSHLCLPAPYDDLVRPDVAKSQKYTCECPDGFKLQINKKKCIADKPVIVSTKAPVVVTTLKPNTKVTTEEPATAQPETQPPTAKPEVTTEKVSSTTPKEGFTNSPKSGDSPSSGGESVGLIAGIVAGVLFLVLLVASAVVFIVYRRYNNRNIKSMNFDNPVYRKTTEDQHFVIGRHGHRENAVRVPLTQDDPEV